MPEVLQKYCLHKPITKDLPRNHTIPGYESKMYADIATKAGIATSDTTSPLLVQGLSDLIIPIFVKRFPFFDMVRKVPSNGLSHTYSQQLAFSQNIDPNTISETGFISDDSNVYNRRTTNIAVFAQRRTLPLKASLAGAAAGGLSADLMGRELDGALLTMARDVQNESLRYQTTFNDTAHGGTGATVAQVAASYQNPDGKFDPNGFNGLRYIANQETPPENTVLVDLSGGTWTDQRVLKAVHNVANFMADKGGMPDMLLGASSGSTALFADQFALDRYEKRDNAEVIPGFMVRTVDTDQGPLPVVVVPGASVGTYVINDSDGNPHVYQDLYVLDSNMLEMPYLGNPEPSVVRIPNFVNGQLVESSVIYGMYGLACLAPSIGIGRVQMKLT